MPATEEVLSQLTVLWCLAGQMNPPPHTQVSGEMLECIPVLYLLYTIQVVGGSTEGVP